MSGQSSFLTYVGDSGIRITLPEPVRARSTDPRTSHSAAASLDNAKSLCLILLRVYAERSGGLTDYEAGRVTLIEGAWKRCSDLRNAGLIAPVREGDKIATRPGPSGRAQQVCAITVEGWRMLEQTIPNDK